MNKIFRSLMVGLLMASLGGFAYADGPRGGGAPHGHYGRHWDGNDWVGPLIFIGVLGAMLATTPSRAEPVYVQPAPSVYVQPPVVEQQIPPANMWYFCRS